MDDSQYPENRSRPVRFVVVEYDKDKLYIDDDDFGYDACIKVSGDWEYPEKLAYAQAVADVLNAAGDKIPVAPERPALQGSAK
jgi:hypothetical protein